MIFWGIVLLVTSFILYYNSETPYMKYTTGELKTIASAIEMEQQKLAKEITSREEAFNKKVMEMAKQRKSITMEEPVTLQKLKIKQKQLEEDYREVTKELHVRSNRSRRLFIGGMITGAIILLVGVALIFKKR